MTEAPLEYVGDLKFGPAAGKVMTSQRTLGQWLERAKDEFTIIRMAMVIGNATDEEMEAWFHNADTPDDMMEMLVRISEIAEDWIETYKAGIDIFNTALVRCIVIGERIEAQQKAN